MQPSHAISRYTESLTASLRFTKLHTWPFVISRADTLWLCVAIMFFG
jgi:hypothetical protein